MKVSSNKHHHFVTITSSISLLNKYYVPNMTFSNEFNNFQQEKYNVPKIRTYRQICHKLEVELSTICGINLHKLPSSPRPMRSFIIHVPSILQVLLIKTQ